MSLTVEDLHRAAERLRELPAEDPEHARLTGISFVELARFVDEASWYDEDGNPVRMEGPLALAVGVAVGLLAARERLVDPETGEPKQVKE